MPRTRLSVGCAVLINSARRHNLRNQPSQGRAGCAAAQPAQPAQPGMVEGRFYTARNGITGRACRHPLHERGAVAYLEKPTGEIIGVFPDTVRRASPSEIQSWRMEFDALEEYEP